MSIIRAPRPESGFYILDKKISEDKRLSWAARGLLVYLLGKPDHWKVSVAALVKETAGSGKATGRDGVYSILRELEAAGYLVASQARQTSGRFGERDYVVSENPPPLPAQPFSVATTQVSTESKQVLRKTFPSPVGDEYRSPTNKLPAWLNPDLWDSFIGHREDLGKPLTPAGQATALAKLERMRDEGFDPDFVIESAINSDRGILLPVINHGHTSQPA